ncbi:MAG: alpha-L-fucosidase, partial [Acidobacteria bacterium]
TSVGWKSWGYIQDESYKSADQLVDEMVDIVSKNGCLLLNVGPRPDGTIPEEAERVLLGIGQWLEVNREAIYGTRPWKIYGEGPTKLSGGYFGERESQAFTAQDIRFTTRDGVLYAICLDWPGQDLKIKSLSSKSDSSAGKVSDVRLLGVDERLDWTQAEDYLTVRVPSKKPCDYAYTFKIILGT